MPRADDRAIRTQRLPLTLTALAVLFAGPALAQMGDSVGEFPSDIFQKRIFLRDGSLAVCVYAESMVGEFNSAVARAVGDALLVNVEVEELDLLTPPEPLDYRIPLGEEELFLMMHGRCDVFMGFPFTSGYPEWINLTVPYFSSPAVLVVTDPSYRSLSDIPVTRPLGTRFGSSTDNQLGTYIMRLPEAARWRRFPYRNYGIAFERVVDGTVGGSLIWEAAVVNATGGDLAANGLHLIELPFLDQPVELAIGVKAEDRYLLQALDQAIEALRSDGTLHALAIAHRLTTASPL